MAKIISISNQKGGVGKSTTAAALCAGLRQRGFKVLAVDLDAQQNLSYTMGVSGAELTTLDILTEDTAAKDAITETEQGQIIAAAAGLATVEMVLDDVNALEDALQPIREDFDYIVIDTPPTLNILTMNALTAATSVLIPAQADAFSLQGLGQLSKTLDTVKKHLNPSLKVEGILLTRFNRRSKVMASLQDMARDTAAKLGTKVFEANIRECMDIRAAAAMQQDIFTYARRGNAAKDYNAFIDELLEG